MRLLTDEEGRRWRAEQIGRTSGIVAPGKPPGTVPEPADILRFTCQSHADEPQRETTIRANVLDDVSDEELLKLLSSARQLRRPKRP
jgi:hypothetical protein